MKSAGSRNIGLPKVNQSYSAEPGSGSKQRVWLVLGILVYVACFQWMYLKYLYPVFDYIGFDYNAPHTEYVVLAWILSVLPSLWMPMKLTRPSQLAYWVLYITVIVPSMFVPLFAGLNSEAAISTLMLTIFAGFAITGSSYLLPLLRFRPARVRNGMFWKVVACVTAGLAIWMVVVFHHQLQIVSFLDVYDLRNAASDVAEGSQVNYTFMLLSGAINPFLMGCGLYYRRRLVFLGGALGQLLVYSVGGAKSSILSVVFVLGFYTLFKVGRLPFALKFISGALALLGGACVAYALTGYDPGPLLTVALFVVLQRTLSLGGLGTAQYYDFFQKNPLTYFSHIKGVDWFVHYPYNYPIGQEIGLAYSGSTNLDATAHFWAADGIGGLGLPGIVLVSIVCALVFWALDSASKRHDPRLAALVTSFAAMNLANISIFTTLLSGGLGLLIVWLYLMPPEIGLHSPTVPGKLKRGIRSTSHGEMSPSH
jgi:O-antigen polymerase